MCPRYINVRGISFQQTPMTRPMSFDFHVQPELLCPFARNSLPITPTANQIIHSVKLVTHVPACLIPTNPVQTVQTRFNLPQLPPTAVDDK